MILVSFVELLPRGINNLGFFWGIVSFFAGMIFMFLIDVLLPHSYKAEQPHNTNKDNSRLMRTGPLVAFGIGIHNLPEGLAAFAGAMQNLRLGISIAIAVAIHNIPEGLAVSAPVYAATGQGQRPSGGPSFLVLPSLSELV
jgi:ZIP family zinc transporter